tara:strand:+ start:405 stop:725 length:321 start_codon:yes stop_codon:yes gene_type:complete
MKITKTQLRRIIREEKQKLLAENRVRNAVKKVLSERKLDPAQVMMLGMTLRNAGADVPELKKGQEDFNGLLTHLMKGDVDKALETIKRVAPDADEATLKSQLFLFT